MAGPLTSEHLIAEQSGISRDGRQDDAHGPARVHAEPNGRRLTPLHASETRAEGASEELWNARHQDDQEAQARVEGVNEVDPEADRREEDRREDVDDEVLDDHARALLDARGADRQADDEPSEYGVQPDRVRRRSSEEREENHQGQDSPGPRGGRAGALQASDHGFDESPADEKERRREDGREQDRLAERGEVDAAAAQRAEE
jgi:hypothetical protein